MDVKWEKVYNFWTLLGWMMSLSFQWESHGRSFVLGTLFPFFFFFPLFLGKMLGTGDIKVFCVLGSVMGPAWIFWCILLSFILGAVISLPILYFRCDYRQRFSYFFTYLYRFLQTKTIEPYLEPGRHPENIHFTIPIFLSVLLLAAGREIL